MSVDKEWGEAMTTARDEMRHGFLCRRWEARKCWEVRDE